MSAQSVAMDEENMDVIRRALTNQEIDAIVIRESRKNDMTYWFDTLLDAAGADNCQVIMTIQDGKIVNIIVMDEDA